jgi:predicted cupin superfamily sugar epimerase
MSDAQGIIKALNLVPLAVEGGFFRETYRSEALAATPEQRSLGTAIYYLMTSKDISRWHKVASDEIWMYHAGSSAIQLLLFADGRWEERVIGPDIASGHVPQSVIPAGTWQAAVLADRSGVAWGLFGAVVFPGFEYEDFNGGEGRLLAVEFPSAESRMRELGLLE